MIWSVEEGPGSGSSAASRARNRDLPERVPLTLVTRGDTQPITLRRMRISWRSWRCWHQIVSEQVRCQAAAHRRTT